MGITGSHIEDEPILDVFLAKEDVFSQFGRTVNPICMFMPRLNHPLSKPCVAVTGVKNCTSILGPVFKEKICPGKVGHPLNQVNFSEPLHEKKVDSFSRANRMLVRVLFLSKRALAYALIVSS